MHLWHYAHVGYVRCNNMALCPPIFDANKSFWFSYVYMNGSERSKHERVAELLYFNLVYNTW